MEEKIKVHVDRNRWLRGEGSGKSRLLRSTDNRMCCLGFCLIAMGKTEDEIRNVSAPAARERTPFNSTLSEEVDRPGVGTPLVIQVTTTAEDVYPEAVAQAMEVNDDPYISDEDREPKLVALLANVGITLTFGDGPES